MGSLRSILKHPDDFYPLLKLKMAARNAEKQIPPEPHWAFCYTMLHKVSRSFALVIQQLDTNLRNAVSIFRFRSRLLRFFFCFRLFSIGLLFFLSGLHILSGSSSARHRWFVFVSSIWCARFLLLCFFVVCEDEFVLVLSVSVCRDVVVRMLSFYFFICFFKLWMLCRDWCYRPAFLGNESDFKILLLLKALENGKSTEKQ